MGWVVNAMPRPLYPLERSGTHCTSMGGWVGLRAGLDGCRKPRPLPGFDSRTSGSAKYFEVQSRFANPKFGKSRSFQPVLQLKTLTFLLPTMKNTANNDMLLRMRAYIKIRILITEVYSCSFFYINSWIKRAPYSNNLPSCNLGRTFIP
jgi:hypothetical protein